MLFDGGFLFFYFADVVVFFLIKDIFKRHNFLLINKHNILNHLLRKWLWKLSFLFVFLHHFFEINCLLNIFIFYTDVWFVTIIGVRSIFKEGFLFRAHRWCFTLSGWLLIVVVVWHHDFNIKISKNYKNWCWKIIISN